MLEEWVVIFPLYVSRSSGSTFIIWHTKDNDLKNTFEWNLSRGITLLALNRFLSSFQLFPNPITALLSEVYKDLEDTEVSQLRGQATMMPFWASCFINNQVNSLMYVTIRLSKRMYMLLDSRWSLNPQILRKIQPTIFDRFCELQTSKSEHGCKIKTNPFLASKLIHYWAKWWSVGPS